jgi:hypothetical protein
MQAERTEMVMVEEKLVMAAAVVLMLLVLLVLLVLLLVVEKDATRGGSAGLQDKQSVIIGKKFAESRPFVIKQETNEKRGWRILRRGSIRTPAWEGLVRAGGVGRSARAAPILEP